MIGIDLFSGAGGMSIGAVRSGIDVKYAVEIDEFAAKTYAENHPSTVVLNVSVRDISVARNFHSLGAGEIILFGGPPCQGFSTSNQKSRGLNNPNNWLFSEYFRIVRELNPDWIVFENVKGLIETEGGFFFEEILTEFSMCGYSVSHFVLNSEDYGVPQSRNRLFLVGSRHGKTVCIPRKKSGKKVSVRKAIEDLPSLKNGEMRDYSEYQRLPSSMFAKEMRGSAEGCWNNMVSRSADYVIERYKMVGPGRNWKSIPDRMMGNYANVNRCHTGIYRRLDPDKPSVVIGNFRKSMLIHPWEDRGLSVREAARLQSFPDEYRFFGSIGFQQQQVGNAVPPKLAQAVFERILEAIR